MADQRLICPALTSLQPCELFAVAEDGLNTPAAALALHHGSEIGLQVIAHQVLVVAVAISGHDQPQVSVFGSVNPQGDGPQLQRRAPLEFERAGQGRDRLLAFAPDDRGLGIKRAMPGQAQAGEAFGQPAGGVGRVHHDVGRWQVGRHDGNHQLLGQLELGLILP